MVIATISRPRSTRSRSRQLTPRSSAAVSLVEAMLAVAVLAVLGVALFATMGQAVRGTSADRLTEARRHLVHDLLERFGHSYTDLGDLFPTPTPPTSIRTLTVDEALAAVAMPGDSARILRATLSNGGVTGFTLAWTPALSRGAGPPGRAVRLDRLLCTDVVSGTTPGPHIESFRLFRTRGQK